MNAGAELSGWRLEVVERIGSTNDALIARAEAGETGRVALRARHQTAARGSRGRSWQEPPHGNLALSALIRLETGMSAAPFVVFAAALALWDALAPALPAGRRLMLKWPNDVLVGDDASSPAWGKVAGILVERGIGGAEQGDVADWLVIGFGVNLRHAPAIEGARALAPAGGVGADPEQVAHRLLGRLDHWWGIAASDGFAPVRAAWLARAHPSGTPLAGSDGARIWAGRFAGLDAEGAALLETEDGVVRLITGRVLLGDEREDG